MLQAHRRFPVKRKGPGKNIEVQKPKPKVESIGYAVGQQITMSPEEEQIITEIVARDIERLCRGGTLDA